MLPIAYNISPFLVRYLEKIELLRQQIVLYPIPPKRELGMQFNAAVQRVHYGLALIDQPLKPETVKTILSNQIVFATQKDTHRYDKMQSTVLQYKQAIDYIKRDWLLSSDAITVKTLQKLLSFLPGEKVEISEKKLQEVITYLYASNESAIVQSAIAKLQFRTLLPNIEQAEIFSTFCAYLFLYKAGLDFRGLAVLEKAWSDDKRIFLGHYQTAQNKPNITSWLEYYVKNFSLLLEATYQDLALANQTTTNPELDKIGKLNERQKTIMTLLEDPQAVITNRTVQKIFHISQITASRDLAKLTMLGLLYTHGKGRSVRYTRT